MTDPIQAALGGLSGRAIWVVGGAVRDWALGRPARDVDIAVEGDVPRVGRALAEAAHGHFFMMHPVSQTARVVLPDGHWVDIVPLSKGLEADLRRRDFTVNALGVPLSVYLAAQPPELRLPCPPFVVDPTGGWRDLVERVVRAASPTAFTDDPVRTLRALRLPAVLSGARIEPVTLDLLRAAVPLLPQASPERRRDEWLHALDAASAAATVELAAGLGLLHVMLPGWIDLVGVSQNPYHHLDVWDHTMAVLRAFDGLLEGNTPGTCLPADLREPMAAYLAENISVPHTRRAILRLAILLHDIGKPAARTEDEEGRVRFLGHERISQESALAWAADFRLSGRERAFLAAVVGLHMRPGGLVTEDVGLRAVRRFFRDAGPAAPALLLLNVADRLGARGPWTTEEEVQSQVEGSWRLLRQWVELSNAVALPLPVSGKDIMEALSLDPGPHIGRLIQELRDLHAENPFHDREAALEAAERIQDSGLGLWPGLTAEDAEDAEERRGL